MILISNQEKGYFITATINHGSYIPEALHVERIDDMALYDGDFEAAKAAEQDGVRLIYGMDGIPDGIYIDTPENRELIRKGLGLYPDYRNWRDDFDPSFVAELDVMQYSTYNRRTHFTPIWYPDGSYTVNTWVIDCWTPAGMLSVNLTDSLNIRGNLWDDWHIAPLDL